MDDGRAEAIGKSGEARKRFAVARSNNDQPVYRLACQAQRRGLDANPRD